MSSTGNEATSALQDDIAILRQELLSVEAKRDALLEKIRLEEQAIFEDSSKLTTTKRTDTNKDQRRMLDILMAYRLTGVTVFKEEEFDDNNYHLYDMQDMPTAPKQIGLRFETFALAQYHEPYYVMLQRKRTMAEGGQEEAQNQDSLQISKHTIPHWIPLRDFEKRYLNRDMSTFTRLVSDYLQAFVGRRENIHQIIHDLGLTTTSISGSISSNATTTPNKSLPHLDCQSMDAAIRDVVLFIYRYDKLFTAHQQRTKKLQQLEASAKRKSMSGRGLTTLLTDQDLDMDIDTDPSTEGSHGYGKDSLDLGSDPPLSLRIHLVYDDLTLTRPSHVSVKFLKGQDRDVTATRSHHPSWIGILTQEDSLVKAMSKISQLYNDTE